MKLCFKCSAKLTYTVGRHKFEGNPCCSDCYFKLVGELVEKHPVAFHRMEI
jgi:hypothetical protein